MEIIIVIISILLLWSIWGYFSSRVEQAEYEVVRKNKYYEIRKYPKHIVAQTTVSGDYKSSMNSGFRIVASYIFGANTRRESISMTAPVVSSNLREAGNKIAMTAPVVIGGENSNRTISFGMPKGYTIDTLPIPNDKRVEITEIPEKTFAVVRFSGYRNTDKIEKIGKKLKDKLAEDKVRVTGNISYAGYNAPWTPPWMTRNEVLVEIY
jgi:effector-binding domain-containing protein